MSQQNHQRYWGQFHKVFCSKSKHYESFYDVSCLMAINFAAHMDNNAAGACTKFLVPVITISYFVVRKTFFFTLWNSVNLCKTGPRPGTHFTNGLWAHNSNLVKILLALFFILMTQSGHKFAHATTAELSWHAQICGLIGSLLFM